MRMKSKCSCFTQKLSSLLVLFLFVLGSFLFLNIAESVITNSNLALASPEICNNGVDEPGPDDDIDCGDPECDGETGPGGFTCECAAPAGGPDPCFESETICDDGGDNDGDMVIDCAEF